MNICDRTPAPSRNGGGTRTPAQVAPGRKLLRRAGGRRHPREAYACAISEDRPRTSRDFDRGSANCLGACRRVGFSQ
ncbi:MAG: hypothetical protein LUP91_07425 [Methylococcaceae bacterium]|nr:hypothetical protein [Methylococcaceae bacterium]